MLLSLRTGDLIFKNRGIRQKIQVYSNSKTRKLSTSLICPLHFSVEIDHSTIKQIFLPRLVDAKRRTIISLLQCVSQSDIESACARPRNSPHPANERRLEHQVEK